MREYVLSGGDWAEIERIADRRYRLWEWNYGRSPKFNIQKSEQFAAGKIEARINVVEGHVQRVKFYGNFTGQRDVAELEQELVGMKYSREALASRVEGVDVTAYFGQLEDGDFLSLLY